MDKQTILTAGVKLAESLGYKAVYKRHVAEKLKCGMGTINYHWDTMKALRTAIVEQAIVEGNLRVVQQAVAWRDPAVLRENGQLIAAVKGLGLSL